MFKTTPKLFTGPRSGLLASCLICLTVLGVAPTTFSLEFNPKLAESQTEIEASKADEAITQFTNLFAGRTYSSISSKTSTTFSKIERSQWRYFSEEVWFHDGAEILRATYEFVVVDGQLYRIYLNGDLERQGDGAKAGIAENGVGYIDMTAELGELLLFSPSGDWYSAGPYLSLADDSSDVTLDLELTEVIEVLSKDFPRMRGIPPVLDYTTMVSGPEADGSYLIEIVDTNYGDKIVQRYRISDVDDRIVLDLVVDGGVSERRVYYHAQGDFLVAKNGKNIEGIGGRLFYHPETGMIFVQSPVVAGYGDKWYHSWPEGIAPIED